MSNSIAIASTQKAGEGDAFILDSSGASRNIGILAQMNAQDKNIAQQNQVIKQKQDYDTQKSFFDNLSDVNLDLRDQDVPFINGKIDEIIKKVTDYKMEGKNPFDMNNSEAYIGVRGDLGKLQAWSAGSKSLKQEERDAQKALYADRNGLYDHETTQKAIDYRSKLELPEAIGTTIQLVQAPLKFGEILDKTLGDNIKAQLKVAKEYSDKGETQKANEIINNIKQGTLKTALSLGSPYIQGGRATNEDILGQANAWIDQYASEALYNPNKDEDQTLARDKFDLDFWKKHQDVAQGWERIDVAKKAAAKLDTNLEQQFLDVADGKTSTTIFQGKPNFETTALKEDGTSELDNNNKPIPSTYGKVLELKTDDSGRKGFSVEILNPITNKVQGTKFIPVYDENGKSVVTTTSAYQNLQEFASKNGYRYVGNTGFQTKAGATSNSVKSATTQVGNLGGNKKENIPTIKTKAEFDALPSGSYFIKNGKKLKKA